MVLAISTAPINVGLLALCHLVTEPTLPVKVNGAIVPPAQIVWLLETVPPTLANVTVTVCATDVSGVQVPDANIALKLVVVVKLPGLYVVVVLLMFIQPVPLLLCQPVIVPVCPLKVNAPGDEPEHTEAVPLTVPPTGAGFTVINIEDELAGVHPPLVTTALK